MQNIIRATLLATCVLSTLAFPNFHQDVFFEHSLNAFQHQLLASEIDTQLISPPEANCAEIFNNRTQKINNNLIAQINNCFANANATTISNNHTTNNTVAAIRRDITIVQFKSENCTSLQDNTEFLKCIIQSFDNNMNLLDGSNARAYQVLAIMAADIIQVNMIRQGCTYSAIGHSKMELVESGNEYTMCLDKISQLRMSQNE